MVDDEATSAEAVVRFETKAVKTIRGLEGRSRSKWEAAGWEFVSEEEGLLRTTLQFRRPK